MLYLRGDMIMSSFVVVPNRKEYIENITNKKVNIYLYSIINSNLRKL